MHLFFLGIANKTSLNFLLQFLAQRPDIKSVTSVVSDDRFAKNLPKHIAWNLFSFEKILLGDYSSYNLGNYRPIVETDIRCISNHLLDILKIADRLCESRSSSFEYRMDLLFKHLKFWQNFLSEKPIDLFVAMDMPHEMQDYLIYVLCQTKGIPTYFFMQSQVPGFCQLVQDIKANDPRFCEPLLGLSSEIIESPILEEHYVSQLKRSATPFYMKEQSAQIKPNKLLKLLSIIKKIDTRHFSLSYWAERYATDVAIGRRATARLVRFYDENVVEPDFSKKYVYVPLHFQPERTTSPQGGIFAFQELMLDMLIAGLPADVYIFVKEHPKQTKHGRSLRFYEKIVNCSNIVLINRHYPTANLLANSIAVATVTGTAGWEALFAQKPVLLFGHIYFQYAPGVYKIQCEDDVRKAFSKITVGEKCNRNELILFLNKMSRLMIRGYSDELYAQHSMITADENTHNLVDSLLQKLPGGRSC